MPSSLVAELEAGGYEVTHHRVDTAEALAAALDENTWDLIISDFRMPTFDGMRAFAMVQDRGVDTPFIFVSGALGEERAVAAMRAGARDYLLKGDLGRLSAAVGRELGEAENRRHQREADEARLVAARRYRSIFESAGTALVETDLRPLRHFLRELGARAQDVLREDDAPCVQAAEHVRVLDANATAVALLRAKSKDRLLGPLSSLLRPASIPIWRDLLCGIAEGRGQVQASGVLETFRGDKRHVLVSARIPEAGVDFENVVLSLVDITERQNLEEQLWRAQRMEAVGRLAGGIAHDFNNLLAVIQSYGSFVADQLPADGEARADLNVMLEAGTKAALLTRQLLAFSRKQVQRLEVISIADTVIDIERMLSRTIGEDVRIHTEIAEDLGYVEADPSHVEQILMNLAVNARDAMPQGGILTIEAANVQLDDAYERTRHVAIPPGAYVMLAVSDTGTGMDDDTKAHLFEPFFTTKEPGKGTGLGLATVYGIVKQSHGYVWVYSELGRGTTFKIYLPRVEQTRRRVKAAAPSVPAPRGHETVLIIEDEELRPGRGDADPARARLCRARGDRRRGRRPDLHRARGADSPRAHGRRHTGAERSRDGGATARSASGPAPALHVGLHGQRHRPSRRPR